MAGALVTYGIILTVVPAVWTPFTAKFMMPKTGWGGVFKVAITFDVIAAILAFFVLRKMKAPVPRITKRPAKPYRMYSLGRFSRMVESITSYAERFIDIPGI